MWGGASPAYPNGFPLDGPAHAAFRQVHRHRHRSTQRRQVGGRRQARPWLAHLRRRSSRLIDHLEFKKFHVIGGCIGGSFCFEAIEQAPDRVVSAVLQNPIGLWENRDSWDTAVKGYGETVRAPRPSIPQSAINSFGKNMFGTDFVFSVTRDFVKNCRTPLFLQPGTDKPHPAHTSEEIAGTGAQHRGPEGLEGAGISAESIKRVHAFPGKGYSPGS